MVKKVKPRVSLEDALAVFRLGGRLPAEALGLDSFTSEDRPAVFTEFSRALQGFLEAQGRGATIGLCKCPSRIEADGYWRGLLLSLEGEPAGLAMACVECERSGLWLTVLTTSEATALEAPSVTLGVRQVSEREWPRPWPRPSPATPTRRPRRKGRPT